jgi:hypothetical protein
LVFDWQHFIFAPEFEGVLNLLLIHIYQQVLVTTEEPDFNHNKI